MAKDRNCVVVWSVLFFRIANIYSQFQHLYCKSYWFCYKFLNYCLFFLKIYKNDWYLYFSRFFIANSRCIILVFFNHYFRLLIYLYFIVTFIFDNIIYTNIFSTNFAILNSYLESNNKPQASFSLTNKAFLFGQEVNDICFY